MNINRKKCKSMNKEKEIKTDFLPLSTLSLPIKSHACILDKSSWSQDHKALNTFTAWEISF
jgi:hypothetical protein